MKYYLTYDEAVALLPEAEDIHTFKENKELIECKFKAHCEKCTLKPDCCDICYFTNILQLTEAFDCLQEENERLKTQLYLEKYTDVAKRTIKAEAYKEFANEFGNMLWQMKTEYLQQGDTEYASALVIIHTKLAKFLKELVGEDNG